MLSRLFRAAGATIVALALLVAAPASAAVRTVDNISVETNLASAQAGAAYSQQIVPSGPSGYTGPYTFVVVGTGLPPGITVSSSGLVSGMTCAANGNKKFSVEIAANGAPALFTGSNEFSFNVNGGAVGACLLTVGGTPPAGTVATAYAGSITTTGGTSPYTYAVVGGALPPGVTLATTGALSGTPTLAGTYSFTVRSTDAGGRTGVSTFSITINAAVPVTLNVNPTTLPGGTTTVAYSQSFSVSNGTAPYTYALTSGAFPNGLSLASGTLSGTPTVAGSYTFTVRATDAASNTGSRTYTVAIAGSNTLTLNPATLSNATRSTAYNQTVTASGGTGAYSYSVSAGGLPTGLTINPSTGAITGTPNTIGTFNFTVRADDANGNYGLKAYAVVVSAATITLAPTSVASAPNGVPYSQVFTATGGTGPYSYSLGMASMLPTGVTLNSNGTLSGTPTSAGTFNFNLIATDALGDTGLWGYSLVITPANITVSPSTLPDATSGTPVSTTFTASGGTGPYTFSVSGSLPPGITLSTGGTLSGTSTTPGTYTFDVTVTDANGDKKTVTVSLTIVAEPLTFSPTSLSNGRNGLAYVENFIAAGGIAPYTFTSSALPTGLVLAVDGTLSGTPSTAAGPYTFDVNLTDATLTTTSRTYTLTIDAASMGIAPAFLPQATAGVAYSQQLFTTGGFGPYTYSFTGTLPPGTTLTGDTVSGTPTAAGTYSFTVTATDANGDTAIKAYSIDVISATVVVDPTTLPDGTKSTAYSQAFTASGGSAPYTYGLTSGAFPAGLALAGDTLSGTPTAAGSYTFTITATDNFGSTGSRTYTVAMSAATLSLSPASLPGATNGVAYSQTFTTTGGTAPYGYASTTLPAGLALSPTGVLSGTPSVAAGSYSFDVTVTDAFGDTTTRTYSILVGGATIAVAPASLAGGANSTPYTATFTATGGAAPYAYASTGTLPTGLSLSGATLSGTPTAAGSYNFTITATDANGDTGSTAYTVAIGAATLTLSPASLPAATNGTAYSRAFTASGGTAAYTYASTTLPAGLVLSSTGVLSGTPNVAAGAYTFDVTVTDANGDTTTVSYTLVVNAATIAVSPASLPGGANSAAYSQTLSASGGAAPYSYAFTGTLPAGLSLVGDTLSGTPTVAGSYNFTVTATDANGDMGSRSYTVAITSATLAITPATLPGAANGVAYSQAFSASGGTPAYSYAVTAGTLPGGLSLTSAGTLAGTPNCAAKTYNVTVTATDANGDTASMAYAIAVDAATVSVTPESLPNGRNGVAYAQSFAATGGAAPYAYTLTSGSLPQGLSFIGDALTGTPTNAGTYDFTIEATDANDDKGTRAYTVVVDSATITMTPDTLPNAMNGESYTATFTATGGTAPYAFQLDAGTLPAGLELLVGGTLQGAPGVAAGTYNFDVLVRDANGDTTKRSYALVVGAANITVNPPTMPSGANGQAYSRNMAANGGIAPYSYALIAGTLPKGLTLANGKVAGTPTAAGTFGFTIEATDANGDKGTRVYSVAIAAATIAIAPDTLAGGTNGTAFAQTFTATGGTAPYAFSLDSGTLPAGLALATNGELTGTPTAAGNYTFSIEATDANGDTATHAYSLAIAGGALLNVDPETLPDATAAEAYAQVLTANGGIAPYTFAITEGALPEGLALTADGHIAGTPTTAGEATFTVTATDKDGNFGTRTYTLAIAEAIVLDITPGTLDEGKGGAPYSATFGATGGTAPYTFTISGGTLPTGVTLSGNGTLSGTPTTPGTYTFTVRGEDNQGHAGTRTFTLVIGATVLPDPTRDPSVIDSVTEQLGAARRQGEMQMSHVFRRLDAPRAPCAASDSESNDACKQPVEIWATGTRDTSFATGTAVTGAFTVGADMQLGNVRFGAALGTGWDLAERTSGYRGDVDGKTWMLYGRVALGNTFGLAAVAGRTDLDLDSRRALGDAGVVFGQRDGTNEFVGVELSGEWRNGDRGLVPYLRYEHARTELDGFAETATSPLALQYGDVNQRNSAFVLGAEAFHDLRFNWGTLTPKVRVELRDRNGNSVNQQLWYLDAPASPYVLAVRGLDERSALAALGLDAAFGNIRLTFEYGTAGSAEDLFQGQSVRLQIRADF